MTDIISRQAAIKAIDDLPNCYNGYSDTYDKAYIIGVLEELPCVELRPIEPKRGKWVEHIIDYWCSECGGRIQKEQVKTYSICPYCGAKMESE